MTAKKTPSDSDLKQAADALEKVSQVDAQDTVATADSGDEVEKVPGGGSPENIDAVLLAEEHLGTDLLNLVLQELKAMPDVWQKLPEYQQGEVIDRSRIWISRAIKRAAALMFSAGAVGIAAEIDGISLKEGAIKTTVQIKPNNKHEALAQFYESAGDQCVILLMSFDRFTGGMDKVKPDPDQADLIEETVGDDQKGG